MNCEEEQTPTKCFGCSSVPASVDPTWLKKNKWGSYFDNPSARSRATWWDSTSGSMSPVITCPDCDKLLLLALSKSAWVWFGGAFRQVTLRK